MILFNLLPIDIKILIFQFLNHYNQLLIMTVCNEWKTILASEIVIGKYHNLHRSLVNKQLRHLNRPELSKYKNDIIRLFQIYELSYSNIGVKKTYPFDLDNALKWAATNGHIEIVDLLINNVGASIKTNALTQSARTGHLNIVQLIEKNGAEIKNNALYWSSTNGHFDIFKYLYSRKNNINDVSNNALRFSSQNGHLNIIKFLVKHNADINISFGEPLRIAIQNGHLHVTKYLISKGADINFVSYITLRVCVKNNHFHIIKFFLNLVKNNK